MNGHLAQTAALAAHARARRLDARLGGDASYWAAHSTFRYVRSLAFKLPKHGLFRTSERTIASTVAEWMITLPEGAEVSLLSLGATGPLAAHIASAFVGGTKEGIAVQRAEHETLWIPGWEVVAQYPDPKIWAVSYIGRQLGPLSHASKPVGQAQEALAAALSRISDFSSCDPALSAWRDTFQKAKAALDTAEPIAPYHPDILPPQGYSRAARQLLAASVAGFVFGGMGSWNDAGFSDTKLQADYEDLTRELYAAVMNGIISAVNEGLSS